MDVFGLDRLSYGQIQNRVDVLLSLYEKSFLTKVQSTPLLKISDFLTKEFKIDFRFDANLGFRENGTRILGCCNPKKRIILIDSSLQTQNEKFNFTLAHELGHLALHRKVVFNNIDGEVELKDADYDFSGKKILSTGLDFMEWQANAYASCLLMPVNIFYTKLVNIQKEMGISRQGKIFIDDQPVNRKDFHEIAEKMRTFFGVSKSVVEYRLRNLDLIDDRRKNNEPTSVKQIISSIRIE